MGGIALVATGLAAATIPAFLYDFLDLTEDDISDPLVVYIAAAVTIGLLVPIGLAVLMTGYSALKGRRWAWKALLIIYGVSITAGIADAILGERSALAGIIINSFIIVYLLFAHVRQYFGRTSTGVQRQSFESLSEA
jgi:hypothetical protein